MFGGIIVVGVLLFTMKGRPRKTWMIPLPPAPQAQLSAGGGPADGGPANLNHGDSHQGEGQGKLPSGASQIDPEFQKFIQTEAKQVDAPKIDSEKKRHEIAQILAKLTPNQARQLLQTATNPASSAGERIVSTYMLVEAGPLAQAQLRELIMTPVSDPGPHKVHSSGEVVAIQERSLRAMAIDGLLRDVEKDPSARETLAKAIPNIPDPYIKSYAEKRLAELPPH